MEISILDNLLQLIHTNIMAQPKDLYPNFSVKHIQNPNRLYATPLLGFVIKAIITIPQMIMLMVLGLISFFVVCIINPFVVLFTGKYWDTAHNLIQGVYNLSAKLVLFWYGLSDIYPGFDLQQTADFTLEIPKPSNPSRLFAIPLLGFIARVILLIPYFIFTGVVQHAALIGAIGVSFLVLFTGKYSESIYELVRDHMRVSFASYMYMLGISDKYPSFWISMNHKNLKIVLLVLGSILYLLNTFSDMSSRKEVQYDTNNTYQNEAVDSPKGY